MTDMEALKKLKAAYWKEIQELSNVKSLNNAMVDYIDKVTHTLKSICTIIAMEEGHCHDDHNDESEEHPDHDEHDDDGSRADKYEALLKEFAGKIQKM